MYQRGILPSDRPLLADWISKDVHHRNTTSPDFFYEKETLCNVYSDDEGIVFFMRGQAGYDGEEKVMQLDIQFDNTERERNGKMLIEVDEVFCQQAKKAGFRELFFVSDSPLLRAFCKRALGFSEFNGLMRKRL